MNYTSQGRKKTASSKLKVLIPILLLIIIGGIGAYLFLNKNKAPADDQTPSQSTVNEEPETPPYNPIDLQSTVENWEANQPAAYSIVVYDLQSKTTIASLQPDKEFFAASLYKQFVAYLALLDIQNGDMNPDEVLSGGFTRKECIDKMIRESHSPCGEAMMADMGQTTLNQRVADMGMKGTYFNGIRTTAYDAALVVQYLAEGRDLNEENTAFLRDAMLTQDAKFKRGLQTGAPDAKWETKVGWNEDINYHDIGIMTLPDGRAFVVAILGQGSGSSAPIADFAGTIYNALMQ